MLEQIGKQAKAAARILAGADTKQKNRALETMAAAVLSDAGAILSANAADMAAATCQPVLWVSVRSQKSSVAVPKATGTAIISATHTAATLIPAGYRLNRAMASTRRRMFFPPLAMEEVPGARAYPSPAMARRMRP